MNQFCVEDSNLKPCPHTTRYKCFANITLSFMKCQITHRCCEYSSNPSRESLEDYTYRHCVRPSTEDRFEVQLYQPRGSYPFSSGLRDHWRAVKHLDLTVEIATLATDTPGINCPTPNPVLPPRTNILPNANRLAVRSRNLHFPSSLFRRRW